MSFFGELYLRSTRPFLSERVTQEEVAYIERAFRRVPPKAGVVLDLGAGHCRHAVRLCAKGLPIVAVELDALSLAERELGCPVVQADFRALPFPSASAAGAYAWYSTLFTGTDAENEGTLREVRRVLQPGALLLFQTVPYRRLAASPAASFRQALPDGGGHLEEASRFDAGTGRDEATRTLHLPDGRVLSAQYFIRYYPEAELVGLLKQCGFRVLWMEGGLAGGPIDEHSTDLIVGAVRDG